MVPAAVAGYHGATALPVHWSSGIALTAVDRPRRAEWTGSACAASAGRVRPEVRQVLVRWRLHEDVIDDAVLVVAELLSNVADHARTPFRLVLELRVRLLHVSVEDHAGGRAPVGMGAAVSGRVSGLRVVNAVALRWGWQEHEAGKTVWAEFVV